MKYTLSACPIHRGCTIELVFGDDTDRRIPLPDPTLKLIAEETSRTLCRSRQSTTRPNQADA